MTPPILHHDRGHDPHRWRRRIETGASASVADLAEQEKVTIPYVSRLLAFTCLAPNIVAAIRLIDVSRAIQTGRPFGRRGHRARRSPAARPLRQPHAPERS